MKASFIALVACAIAVCTTASADCMDLTAVPLATKSVKESKGQVCGFSYLVTQQKGGKSVAQLGVADTWFKNDFSGAHFQPVAFPVGHQASCPQHAPANQTTAWSGVSNIYVRREFEISAESLGMIKDMVVQYIIDDQILKVYINGALVPTGKRISASGCGYWAATNSFTVPASFLKAGQNVLAVEAVNTGGPCYMDLGVSFSACSEGSAMSELHSCSAIEGPGIVGRGCRARCDEENYCRNKDPEDCGTSFHADVTGSCFCEAAESVSCSGESADVAPGVCYESSWMASQVSRVAFCSPKTETSCSS